MYTIVYEFDAFDEPPKVCIAVGNGSQIIEVYEAPTLTASAWSRDDDDWEPGPLARALLALLNTDVWQQSLSEQEGV